MDAYDKATGPIVLEARHEGWRLDRAAELLWPGLGLRGRRRRIEAGLVTVSGRTRGPGYKVRAGEVLVAGPEAPVTAAFAAGDIPVLVAGSDYGAVAKPGGLHSVDLGSGGGESLEALLPLLFPGRSARLLSRLDRLTSGVVPLAFTEAAAANWLALERAGGVAKTYLAVVHGRLEAAMTLARELDMDDRARVRVLSREASDPLRHTAVTPERFLGGLTLVRCRIARGARHQIRAHLAAAGHPLVGDPLYGRGEGGRLYLHCAAVDSAVLAACQAPPWEAEAALAAVDGG